MPFESKGNFTDSTVIKTGESGDIQMVHRILTTLCIVQTISFGHRPNH